MGGDGGGGGGAYKNATWRHLSDAVVVVGRSDRKWERVLLCGWVLLTGVTLRLVHWEIGIWNSKT